MSKPLSILLLVIAASLTLWRGTEAFIQFWKYLRLDTELSAKIENWQVEELSRTKFAVSAFYSYQFQDQVRTGKSQLEPPYFPNRYAALDEISHLPSKEMKIWIDSSKPSHTALEKTFPWRSSLYALSSLVILLYFIYIFSAETAGKPFGKR